MEFKNGFLNKLFGFINKAGTVIMINVLFLVSCLPVVTIGAAWSALYSAIRYMIRGDSWFSGFKEGYRRNLVRNLIAWTLGLALGIFSFLNVDAGVRALLSSQSWTVTGNIIPLIIDSLFLLVALIFTTAMIPVGLYFESDASSWVDNTLDLIRRAPLQVLASTVLMWAPVVVILYFPLLAFQLMVILVAAYFVLACVAMTGILKKPLIQILRRIRIERGEDPDQTPTEDKTADEEE